MHLRDNYLLWMEKYPYDVFQNFYQDETWLNKNMAPSNVWRYGENSAVHYKYRLENAMVLS